MPCTKYQKYKQEAELLDSLLSSIALPHVTVTTPPSLSHPYEIRVDKSGCTGERQAIITLTPTSQP